MGRERCLHREYLSLDEHADEGFAHRLPSRPLRLISFNMQVGIHTQRYHHYLTRSWQHLLPTRQRQHNLQEIARNLRHADLVALQEVDGGSLRSGHVNQLAYLAEQAEFPCYYQQLNRNLGALAQHSNGLLARYRPWQVHEYRLPGLIPGRGALVAFFGSRQEPLVVATVHLALGPRGQQNQLAFLAERLLGYRHLVVMGDMNAPLQQIFKHAAWRQSGLHSVLSGQHTYPSWQPKRCLDHIFVSSELVVHRARVLQPVRSDHLPLEVEIHLPESIVK